VGENCLARFSPICISASSFHWHISIFNQQGIQFTSVYYPEKAMGLFASNRNYGYGKQMHYAVKNALTDHYGGGHYGTMYTHLGRWTALKKWLQDHKIKDLTLITKELFEQFAEYLSDQIANDYYSAKYSTNILSSANVILFAIRGNNEIFVSPSKYCGILSAVRTTAPDGLDPACFSSAINDMIAHGYHRGAVICQLARYAGMRVREATLGHIYEWIKQAESNGEINIQRGTKGGRNAPRWILVTPDLINTLKTATIVTPNGSRNMLKSSESFIDFYHKELQGAIRILKRHGIKNIRELRAAWACEWYQRYTGHPAPAITGKRLAEKHLDTVARACISHGLGHGRISVSRSYVGSAK